MRSVQSITETLKVTLCESRTGIGSILIYSGAILVYDITDEDSFQKVKVWVKELRRMVGPDICLIIAGNKADLERCIECKFIHYLSNHLFIEKELWIEKWQRSLLPV